MRVFCEIPLATTRNMAKEIRGQMQRKLSSLFTSRRGGMHFALRVA